MEQHQNGNGQTEQVTTVFVAGFPADTTHREVDNLCRFMPGFVKSKVSFSRGITLFALFDSVESAEAAIHTLKDQAFDASRPSEIMRVVMAKSNMRITDSGPPGGPAAFPAYPSQPAIGGRGISDAPRFQATPRAQYATRGQVWSQPPPPSPVGGGYVRPSAALGGPAKRPRTALSPDSVDTVACVGAADAGVDQESLQNFFAVQPGFVAFKANPRMGGGFAKFETPERAREAIQAAQVEGIPAAVARTSMAS
mmetsp:Transcript_71673/g.171172  ORF Transcript_71673/g.171172 Transcript_71673/m.171172 type:complete len:253 (+) Transcript_71673:53-811(+)